MTATQIQEWHNDEIEWWNKFSHIMAKQWQLDDYSNNILRKSTEEESFNYLIKKNGLLLDLGCGSGWLSFKFGNDGMATLGLDFSEEQIKLANQYKIQNNVVNSSFVCCDIFSWDYSNYHNMFDSIHISAFLHHLPEEELDLLFEVISKISKDGAKIYLYEPIYFADKKLSLIKKISLFFINKSFSVLMYRLPSLFNCWEQDYKDAQKEGYTGTSPHESALNYKFFKMILKKYSLEIENITPSHYKSIVYAILANSMKNPLGGFLKKGIPLIMKLDQFLFKVIGWKNIGEKRDFLLCSIKIKKSQKG